MCKKRIAFHRKNGVPKVGTQTKEMTEPCVAFSPKNMGLIYFFLFFKLSYIFL